MSKKEKILKQFLLAGAVFLLTQIVLTAVLSWLRLPYFNPDNWSRWDSGHYLQIANKGYELFPCAGKFGYPPDAKEMCGNTGWFPGYPLLIRLLSPLSKNAVILSGVLSKVFYLLALFAVLVIVDIYRFSLKNVVFVCIAAFSFGFIYYNAIFPISCVLFFILAGFLFLLKEKLWPAGLFCLLAAFFYPTGFLLSVVFALFLLIRENDVLKKKLFKALIPVSMGGLGVLLVFTVFQVQVGDWSAFIQVQSKYSHGFHNPINNIGNMMKKISLSSFPPENFMYLQSALVITGHIILSFFFFLKKMHRTELYLLTYIYITVYLLFIWTIIGNLSMYRAESLLLPFVFLLKQTNLKWALLILVVLLAVGIPMSYLFFKSILI